ncbi:MAG TPA: hypothetical protein VIC29_15390 [Steroidobacteraceae bacterium]|jgi:hypothetical protein
MSETKPVRITGVKLVRDYTLTVAFKKSKSFTVDLRDFVQCFKGLRAAARSGRVRACQCRRGWVQPRVAGRS